MYLLNLLLLNCSMPRKAFSSSYAVFRLRPSTSRNAVSFQTIFWFSQRMNYNGKHLFGCVYYHNNNKWSPKNTFFFKLFCSFFSLGKLGTHLKKMKEKIVESLLSYGTIFISWWWLSPQFRWGWRGVKGRQLVMFCSLWNQQCTRDILCLSEIYFCHNWPTYIVAISDVLLFMKPAVHPRYIAYDIFLPHLTHIHGCN